MAYSNETYKELAQAAMAASDTVIYGPVATNTTTIIRQMTIVNVTASAITVKLWHTAGGAGSDATLILPNTTIAASGFANFDGVIILDAADSLRGLVSTASAATITVYGVELV